MSNAFAGGGSASGGPWNAGGDDAAALAAIVGKARDGDRDAFAQLYERYADTVYRYVYWRVGGDAALAEDLTSDTFMRALRAIHSFTYRGRDPGGWFLTIAKHLLLDHVKSARHRLEVPTGEFPDHHRATDGPEEAVLGTLTVAEAMGGLAEDQRECVQLRVLLDLSVAETAELMGKSEGAVKALQHRAMRRLANRLQRSVAGE
jgi:RNA polymerase sigma-70 factor (ECF subfamily)